MKKSKKICSLLLIAIILLTAILNNKIYAANTTVDALKNKYVAGSFWYESFDGGSECAGFARLLFYEYYGVLSSGIGQSYDINSIKPGDILRYVGPDTDPGGHEVWVIGVDSEKLIVGECNYYQYCEVSWDRWIYRNQISSVQYIKSAPYAIENGDKEAPKLSDLHIQTTRIGKDSIVVRVKATDNVGVTGVKFRVWQSGNSANSGTTKWGSPLGNGYYEVTFTASEAKKVEDNLCCVECWAYDQKENQSSPARIYDFVFGQKVTSLGNFVARIVPTKFPSYCIGVSGTKNGDDLKLKTKNLSDSSQLWKFEKATDGTYKITHLSSGKSFDTDGGVDAKDDGTIMQLWSYNQDATQMKYLIQSYNGAYRIVPVNQNEVRGIDIKDGKANENQTIQIYKAETKTNKAQTWNFEKVATSLTIGTTYNTVKVGTSKRLSRIITPTDVANNTLQWSSSDTSIATVSSSGIVTGIKTGPVTITAKTTDGSNKTATCRVVVTLPYTDVNSGDWYYYAVEYLHNKNYMTGTKKNEVFSPNEKLTRGMLVTILHRMEGTPYVPGASEFPDVQDTKAYYYSSVKWAAANKIVSGYDNGKFGPNDPITREQLAVMLNNYCKYKGKYKATTADFAQYKDGAKISNWAKWGMNWAVGSGVITGNEKTNTLDPQGLATRAETASMMYKYCLNFR